MCGAILEKDNAPNKVSTPASSNILVRFVFDDINKLLSVKLLVQDNIPIAATAFKHCNQ